jgi:hypothetical protein
MHSDDSGNLQINLGTFYAEVSIEHIWGWGGGGTLSSQIKEEYFYLVLTAVAESESLGAEIIFRTFIEKNLTSALLGNFYN